MPVVTSLFKHCGNDGTERSSRELDRRINAIDKMLDRAVAKIGLGRPTNLARIGPKLDGRWLPTISGNNCQERSAPITYFLPSRRKKLNGQIPENVRVTKELHPVKWAGVGCVNTIEIVDEGITGSSLKRCDPHLSHRRNGKRQPQSLSGESGEKQVIVPVSVVHDGTLHE